jgi:hypothetical protein
MCLEYKLIDDNIVELERLEVKIIRTFDASWGAFP